MLRRMEAHSVARNFVRRGGLSAVESEVFAATERLLAQMPIADLSVALIVKEAGISRARFYYHFKSKLSVLAALFMTLPDELSGPFEPLLRDWEEPPDVGALWSDFLRGLATIYKEHADVLRAVTEQWHGLPELRRAWLAAQERSSEMLTQVIDHHRARGLARPGFDSRRLATAIVIATGESLHMADLDGNADIDQLAAAIEPLFVMLAATLYGHETASAAPLLSTMGLAQGSSR